MVGFCVDVGSEPGKASEKLTFVKGKWRGVETPRGSRVSAGRMGALSSVVQALACSWPFSCKLGTRSALAWDAT